VGGKWRGRGGRSAGEHRAATFAQHTRAMRGVTHVARPLVLDKGLYRKQVETSSVSSDHWSSLTFDHAWVFYLDPTHLFVRYPWGSYGWGFLPKCNNEPWSQRVWLAFDELLKTLQLLPSRKKL